MSIEALDPESLSTPLSAESPSGPDLAYDPRFIQLEQAGAGKPDRQYGDKHYPAEAPDWPVVHELALDLVGETRDLRLAVWLTRSGARLNGLAGFATGLVLVQRLLSGLWDSLHPQLDAADNNDPTMRLNTLTAFTIADAALADLRAAALAPVRGSLTVREIELALGRADPEPGETVPTEAGLLTALSGLLAGGAVIGPHVAAARQAARDIVIELDNRVGSANAPDLSALTRLLALLGDTLERVQGPAPDAAAVPVAGASTAGPGGSIRNRGDAARELGRVCEWIESNEPSNPAPLLIRRAQRLMDKSFLEIIRDLAPDGLGQVERIAGTEATS
jgi:type VI secretion system protein ImpA